MHVEKKKKQLAALEKGKSSDEAASLAFAPSTPAVEGQAKPRRLKKYPIEQLKLQLEDMKSIFTFLDAHYKEIKDKCTRLAKSNSITYRLLWTIFRKDQYITAMDDDAQEPIGLQLKSTSYEDSPSSGKYVNLSCQYIEFTGEKNVRRWKSIVIKKFKGQRKVSSLDAMPMTAERRTELTERGRIYREYSKVAFVSYTGELIKVSFNAMGR